MKIATICILIFGALCLGGYTGWRYAVRVNQNHIAFYAGGLARSEIHVQQQDAVRAYFDSSEETAIWALNKLLRTYDRYEDWRYQLVADTREAHQYGRGLMHGRLALLYASIGDLEKSTDHERIALELTGATDKESLYEKVELLDRAQRSRMRQ